MMKSRFKYTAGKWNVMMNLITSQQGRTPAQRLPPAVAAGLISTVVMTVVMEQLYKALPRNEQYPLPPEEIAIVAEATLLGRLLDKPQHRALTLVSHFGYGTTLGALYALLQQRLPLPRRLSGVTYGIAVWAGGYLGWLPALRVLRPVTEFPPARLLLLILAHVVWGAVLDVLTGKSTLPRKSNE
jgi:uncharacterized membrane protein YagU involved in acid resistance